MKLSLPLQLRVVASLLLLSLSIPLNAQIYNDSCVQAFSFDTIHEASVTGCYNGETGFDTFMLFTNGFGPIGYETPYWAATNFCGGYASATQPGWNDMWFKFVPEWGDRNIKVFFEAATDSVNLTLWSVKSCDTMQSLCCGTYADTSSQVYGTINCFVTDSSCRVGDWIYIQLSSPDSINLQGICIGISQIGSVTLCCPFGTFCFEHQISFTQPTTDTSMNGTASVTINWGTGPFTYLWDDGDTSSTRTDLDTGLHIVTITDRNGCMEVDSIYLTASFPTSVQTIQKDLFRLYPNPSNGQVKLNMVEGHPFIEVVITHANGAFVDRFELESNRMDIGLDQPGVYIFALIDTSGKQTTRRVVIN